MKNQVDKRRVDRRFVIEEWVYLKLQPYEQNTLVDRQFQNLALSTLALTKWRIQYEHQLINSSYPLDPQLHPVFHVSQLKKKLGTIGVIGTQLPVQGDVQQMELVVVLDKRTVKEGIRL